MGKLEIMRVMLLSVPIYGATLCGLLMIKLAHRKESSLDSKILLLAAASYAGSIIAWLSAILYFELPTWFIEVNPIGILANMLLFVFSYHFVFEVTRMNDYEKFHIIHYLIPILIFSFFLIFSFLLPFDKQLLIVESQKECFTKYPLSYLLYFLSNPILLIVYNTFYAIMSLFRAKSYRRAVVHFSADEQRGAILWIYHLIVAMLAIVPILIGVFLLSGVIQTFFIVLLVSFSIYKYTILTHNVMLENFVLIRHNADDDKSETFLTTLDKENIRQLEAYMHRKKPYLNSNLKITDLISDLHTNRTSLSILINKNYGMNFCRYINRFRLDEFEKLRANSANDHLLEIDLVLMAGFSDWRGYQRVKKQETMIG